jgi:multidrug efflux pump subunit AcrB
VRSSINEVVREACIAAALTGLMILLFLGSWRSTLIVCISIPLSIATSLIILSALGETINVMTLGGLALAVGILVDDATVEIENTHRNMAEKLSLTKAILTQTTFSVPSLMGAIMTIGVATANSILLVVFANDERLAGKDRREAALNAGHTRLRPVLMTALAMIIGMLPMALAFGEGGEQNAPLGRAVIGGLLFATLSTLFLVPTIYSLLKKHAPIDYSKEIDEEASPELSGHGQQPPNPSHGSQEQTA